MALRLAVHGRVQGVGFRALAARRARELAIRGWVRNAAGGEVEALAIGSPEAVEEFARRLGEGPPGARVTAIERLAAGEGDAGDGFEIRA